MLAYMIARSANSNSHTVNVSTVKLNSLVYEPLNPTISESLDFPKLEEINLKQPSNQLAQSGSGTTETGVTE